MAPGGSTRDSWTLYPDGVPTPIDLKFTRLKVGPDQHDALMIETIPPSEVTYEENDRRLVEAMRHSSIMIRYFSLDGALRFANPAAIEVFDDVIHNLADPTDAFSICLARPELAPEMFEKCIQNGSFSGEFEVRTSNGARWHRIELHNIIDPEQGDRSILVTEEDITSIKHAETAAAMSERLLYDAIESLSVGFIMLDADRRIVLVNEKYREMHRKIGGEVELGMKFEELLRQSTRTKTVLEQEGRADEWAWLQAYHAADAEPIAAGKLAEIDEEDLDTLRFETHPSLWLIESEWPVISIWLAHQGDEMPDLSALPEGPQHGLIVRPYVDVQVQIISASASRLIDHLADDQPLGAAFDAVADMPDAAPSHDLVECFATGCVVGLVTS